MLASIYDHLHQELNVHFAGAYRAISADKSDEYDQQYLNCAENDPVLEVQQVVYLKDGQPIEYSSSRNRFDVRTILCWMCVQLNQRGCEKAVYQEIVTVVSSFK